MILKKDGLIHMKLPANFMKNTYRIIWSDEALINLKQILNYFERQWTEKEISNFVRLLNKRLSSIERNPYLFPFV